MKKNFYMTLLSNSSLDYFPDNKTGAFTVQLPRYMYLEGNWEVALAEIQYPYTFTNVESDHAEILLETVEMTAEFVNWYINERDTVPKPFETVWTTHKIIPGFYANITDIIDAINECIKGATQQESFFEYNTRAHRVGTANDTVEVGRKWIKTCKLSPRLGLQLGYPPNEEILSNGTFAPHVASTGNIIPDKMIIYCDILEPQIIGDRWGRVLRIVDTNAGYVSPNYGQTCSTTFNTLQYIPIQPLNFEAIRIDIRDIEGQLMPFQHGTLSVKLHFRQN